MRILLSKNHTYAGFEFIWFDLNTRQLQREYRITAGFEEPLEVSKIEALPEHGIICSKLRAYCMSLKVSTKPQVGIYYNILCHVTGGKKFKGVGLLIRVKKLNPVPFKTYYQAKVLTDCVNKVNANHVVIDEKELERVKQLRISQMSLPQLLFYQLESFLEYDYTKKRQKYLFREPARNLTLQEQCIILNTTSEQLTKQKACEKVTAWANRTLMNVSEQERRNIIISVLYKHYAFTKEDIKTYCV